jgi:fumarylacetoacetate (FAA) hydrolase family protein
VLIMALDLATVTGYAIGRAGSIPRSGSVRLRYPDQERGVAPFNLMAFLRDRFVLEKPDLIAVEDMMGAPAIKSADAAVAQIMLHGVIEAMARINAIRLDRVHRATLLKHFIGRGRTGERATTKRAVIEQAKLQQAQQATQIDAQIKQAELQADAREAAQKLQDTPKK